VKCREFRELHAPFLKERRTSGLVQGCVQEIRGISLVFREMWDTRTLMFVCEYSEKNSRCSSVVSHISRKTSEIWGTQDRSPVKGFDQRLFRIAEFERFPTFYPGVAGFTLSVPYGGI
jgi:hypothetical protein